VLVAAGVTALVTALLMNMNERKREAEHTVFKVVDLDENSIDPALWGQNFPRQYDSYKRTVDTERTRYGGSEAFQKLDEDRRWRRIFDGYAFSIDYREERGHAYMLSDQDETERVKNFKQPGACLHCHSSITAVYKEQGNGDLMAGFEKVCAMPLSDARQLVKHPVSCIDCHDPKTTQLRVTRPGFLNAIQALAKSTDPLPHLASIERWRKGDRKTAYDVNKEATRQEMRSFVCGQCHVEYYFKGPKKVVTYPWDRGLKVEKIEEYYDETKFFDWKHKETDALVLKAQHPEFELWNQGTHARRGVACADCHMPYVREGAIKVSDHHVRSPLLMVNRSCQTCHRATEDEIKSWAIGIQDRTQGMMDRATAALVDLLDAIRDAKKRGVADEKLATARKLQRQAQWRLDFVSAENSMGFHAPHESARILLEATDLARQGQVEALKQ